MANKRKRADAVLAATLPRVRVYKEELQSVKQACRAQRINLSDFIRNAVLRAIPPPIDLPSSANLADEKKEFASSETGGLVRASEAQRKVRAKFCVHGFKVVKSATQCTTCANLGVQYRE